MSIGIVWVVLWFMSTLFGKERSPSKAALRQHLHITLFCWCGLKSTDYLFRLLRDNLCDSRMHICSWHCSANRLQHPSYSALSWPSLAASQLLPLIIYSRPLSSFSSVPSFLTALSRSLSLTRSLFPRSSLCPPFPHFASADCRVTHPHLNVRLLHLQK